MKTKKIFAMCLVIILALGLAASAAPKSTGGDINANWWGKAPGQRPTVRGVVAGVSATNIAIQLKEGAKSFLVTDKTRVVIRGQKATIADVKAGDQGIVRFALQKNNVPVALGITISKPIFGGEVVSIQGNAITVNNKKIGQQQVIAFNEQTKFRAKGYEGSIENIKPGVRIAAVGTITNNQLTADVIEFVPTLVKGTVVAIDGDVITVKTVRQRSIPLKASQKTAVLVRPRIGPNKRGTLDDVKVGAPVNVGFEPVKDAPSPLLWIDVLTGM